jgi:light-regulated signal transduction histidine kinase (bacteriophytochrome)
MATEQIRVLLIEDSAVYFEDVTRQLRSAQGVDFQSTGAMTLADGLARLAEGNIDVVLLDLILPDSQGLGTFQKLRLYAPDVPIIVLTGIDDEALAVQAAKEGAQEYLVKGQTGRDLLVRTVRYALQRHRMQVQLQEKALALEASNKELEQFAYVASHDLQEPLRKIQAFGERLSAKCQEGLSEEGRNYVARMQNAAARMQALINDLLTLSRVTTRGEPFVSVDLGGIAKDVVSDMEVRIEQVGGRVVIGELPTIEADPIQMQRLFQNLIGNALKFHNEHKPPSVRVTAARGTRGEDTRQRIPRGVWCQISFEDNGIGFDEKYLDRIFGVFQRLHHRDAYEGTGIGLAICRKIVDRHGGTITATSQVGVGSTFLVTLPIRQLKQGPTP